jgi:hypothetical protein
MATRRYRKRSHKHRKGSRKTRRHRHRGGNHNTPWNCDHLKDVGGDAYAKCKNGIDDD